MPLSDDVDTWDGQTLLTTDGEKIGKIESIYLDGETDEPAWLAVKTGKLSSAVSLVPVERASATDDGVTVPYDKQQIKDAPTFKPDDEISSDDAQALYEHYAVGSSEPSEPSEAGEAGEPAGEDESAPTGDIAEASAAREPINQSNLG